MKDETPRGYNLETKDGSVVFLGRKVDDTTGNVHLYFRNAADGVDTRLIISLESYTLLCTLINGNILTDKLFNQQFIGDKETKYGVRVRTFDIPKQKKEPEKKRLFDWE